MNIWLQGALTRAAIVSVLSDEVAYPEFYKIAGDLLSDKEREAIERENMIRASQIERAELMQIARHAERKNKHDG